MSQDQPRSSESIHPELPSELVEKPASPITSNAPEPLADSAQSPVVRENVSRSAIGNQQSSRRTLLEDEILPQTLLRLVGEAFIAAQAPLKQQSIKALQGTIHCLETAVERLQAAPAPKRKTPALSVAAENVLPSRLKSNTGRQAPISTNALWEHFQTLWRRLWRSWRSILWQLRDRLPTSFNRNVSDRALTGAIAGIMAIVLWATASLLPDQPVSTTVATSPAVTVTPSPEPTPPTPVPLIVQAPEMPKLVEISPAPIKPSLPSPPLKLTPEQTLIARIQDQVAAISNQYASDLVQSVQANFRGSRLIVNISDGWYGLSGSQQDRLAGELLQRTQTLDFSKLEMVDSAGTLLARSPIVGADVIILKRTV